MLRLHPKFPCAFLPACLYSSTSSGYLHSPESYFDVLSSWSTISSISNCLLGLSTCTLCPYVKFKTSKARSLPDLALNQLYFLTSLATQQLERIHNHSEIHPTSRSNHFIGSNVSLAHSPFSHFQSFSVKLLEDVCSRSPFLISFSFHNPYI